MAFDTAFNITWNQRVNKEETAFLKFLDKRKQEEEAKNPPPRRSQRRPQKAMSDADLMSAIQSERMSNAGSSASRGRSGMHRSRGSAASSSVLQRAGSSVSSPSAGRKKRPPMTFEQQQEHVFNQYMNKYITDLEKEAKEGKAEQEWMKVKIKEGHQAQIDEKTKARQLAEENQRQLMEQIEENKNRRASTRKQFVEAASAHNFPLFTETFISQDEVDAYRKQVKIDWREELNQQNHTTMTLKNMIKKRDQIYAAEKQAQNIKNMQDYHKHEHEEKLRKGTMMMNVWDRDIRLKNIKNAILSGKDATKEMGVSDD